MNGTMMRLWLKGLRLGLPVVLASIGGVMAARAAPLEPMACEQLQMRLEALRKDGVEADMAMGPEAARTRLPIDRFNRIGTYIEVEEQLNFRCGLAKQRIVLPSTVEGGEEEIPAPGEAAAPKPRPVAKDPVAGKGQAAVTQKPAPKSKRPATRRPPASKSKEAGDTAAKGAEKQPAKAPPKKKAVPKKPAAKVDDAYRPPPKPVVRDESKGPATKQ